MDKVVTTERGPYTDKDWTEQPPATMDECRQLCLQVRDALMNLEPCESTECAACNGGLVNIFDYLDRIAGAISGYSATKG